MYKNYKQKIIEVLQEKKSEQYTPLQQIMLGGMDFWNSYQDMRKKNLIGFDKYAHAYANANATKRGKYGEKTAEFISAFRELNDALKHHYQNPIDLAFDIQEDLNANKYGREQAKKYPNIPTHELLQKYWVKDETGQVAK